MYLKLNLIKLRQIDSTTRCFTLLNFTLLFSIQQSDRHLLFYSQSVTKFTLFAALLNDQIHIFYSTQLPNSHCSFFFLLNNQIHTVYSTQRPNLHFLFYSTTKSTQLCLLNDQIRTVYFTQRLNSHCSHFSSTCILVAIRSLSLYLSFPPTVISLIPYYFTIIAHGPSACPSRLKIINLTCTRF